MVGGEEEAGSDEDYDPENPGYGETKQCRAEPGRPAARVEGAESEMEEDGTSSFSSFSILDTLVDVKAGAQINLARAGIGNHEATTLAAALRQHTSVTGLNMSFNSIGDEGATAVTVAIEGSKVRILRILRIQCLPRLTPRLPRRKASRHALRHGLIPPHSAVELGSQLHAAAAPTPRWPSATKTN